MKLIDQHAGRGMTTSAGGEGRALRTAIRTIEAELTRKGFSGPLNPMRPRSQKFAQGRLLTTLVRQAARVRRRQWGVSTAGCGGYAGPCPIDFLDQTAL